MMSSTRAGLLVLLLSVVALPVMAAAIPPADSPASATPAAASDAGLPAQAPSEETAPAPPETSATAPVETPAPRTAPGLDSGDTAWMLTATALVLFMTMPGLSLFYAGMVRAKNVLSVMMQCFAITSLVTILWMLWGYSLAFDTTGMQDGVINLRSFIGSLNKVLLNGVERDSLRLSVPETVFMTFQMSFAILTPALMVGAFAERMKFSAMLWFTGLWLTLVYCPIAHMAWSGAGSLIGSHWGALDFAGGTVVHINAGVAGLIAALVLGKRRGYPEKPMPPHDLRITVAGASMLWVGWFGFNAGSAGAADGVAGMAMAVVQIAAASAALAWMFSEWVAHGKPSVLGIATGAVAGLVAITPAAGSAGPLGALLIGATAGVACFLASTRLKRWLGYDDSLDAFGVHAIGGTVGALLTGVCAGSLGGIGLAAGMTISGQVTAQLKAVAFTWVYTAIVSYLILKVVDAMVGLRVNEQAELQGLDIALHDERGYQQ